MLVILEQSSVAKLQIAKVWLAGAAVSPMQELVAMTPLAAHRIPVIATVRWVECFGRLETVGTAPLITVK